MTDAERDIKRLTAEAATRRPHPANCPCKRVAR